MNKSTKLTAATVIAVASLWGQARAEHVAKTVDWYVQHPDWRAKVNAACMNDPGGALHMPDCLNAAEATQRTDTRNIVANIDKSIAENCAKYDAKFRQTYCQ